MPLSEDSTNSKLTCTVHDLVEWIPHQILFTWCGPSRSGPTCSPPRVKVEIPLDASGKKERLSALALSENFNYSTHANTQICKLQHNYNSYITIEILNKNKIYSTDIFFQISRVWLIFHPITIIIIYQNMIQI